MAVLRNDLNDSLRKRLEENTNVLRRDNYKKWTERLVDMFRKKKVIYYYSGQNELIESFFDADKIVNRIDATVGNNEPAQCDATLNSSLLSKISSRVPSVVLIVNLILTIAKIVSASFYSFVSLIASTVDSCFDIFSGLFLWLTSRSMRKVNIYVNPQGKSRMEPVSVLILSCVMAVLSVQIIIESIKRIVNKDFKEFSINVVVILAVNILAKIFLFLICRTANNITAKALSQDQLNDIFSNSISILGICLSKYWPYLDPLGAIIISIYIFINWWRTGKENISYLTGKSAPPSLLQKITWVALNHEEREVVYIDTVRAYSFGTRYLVEVDIVLPPEMTLRQSHNIGEHLQRKLEALDEVERAFVHLDYEITHNPTDEHKIRLL